MNKERNIYISIKKKLRVKMDIKRPLKIDEQKKKNLHANFYIKNNFKKLKEK